MSESEREGSYQPIGRKTGTKTLYSLHKVYSASQQLEQRGENLFGCERAQDGEVGKPSLRLVGGGASAIVPISASYL